MRRDCTSTSNEWYTLEIPPTFMKVAQVVVFSQLEIRRHVALSILLSSGLSIAKVSKSIPRDHITVFVVFPARIAPRVCNMSSRARPN